MLPVLFIFVMYFGFPKILPNFYLTIFIAGVLDIIAFVLEFKSIKLSNISLLAPMASFNPVFTALIAMVFLGEGLSPLKFSGILIIVLGSYLLHVKDIKSGLLVPFKNLFADKGVKLFLVANLLWSITPIFQKQAIFQTSPKMPVLAAFFDQSVIVFFTTFWVIFQLRKRKLSFPIKDHLPLFLIIAVFGAIGGWVGLTAFSLTNVAYVTAVFKLSTLFTIIFGAIFFKEGRIGERLLGASVMILGTILLVL